jgi:hypothetical protein
MGIAGVDTRAITRRLRVDGCLNGVICTDASISGEELPGCLLILSHGQGSLHFGRLQSVAASLWLAAIILTCTPASCCWLSAAASILVCRSFISPDTSSLHRRRQAC